MAGIELRDFCVRRGNRTVLSTDVTHLGDTFITVVGVNGSGKSSLIGAMAGVLPHRGTIEVGGSPITRVSVGYAPQSIRWPQHLTARDVCELAFRLRAPRRGRTDASDAVEEALARTRLEPQASTPVHSLSGGQRKRLTVAQALCPLPRVLLLDEPTSETDVVFRHEFAGVLHGIDQEVTVVSSTHLLEDVEAWGDYVTIAQAGGLTSACLPAHGTDARTAAVREISTQLGRG